MSYDLRPRAEAKALDEVTSAEKNFKAAHERLLSFHNALSEALLQVRMFMQKVDRNAYPQLPDQLRSSLESLPSGIQGVCDAITVANAKAKVSFLNEIALSAK
jgi:hypothetical protein